MQMRQIPTSTRASSRVLVLGTVRATHPRTAPKLVDQGTETEARRVSGHLQIVSLSLACAFWVPLSLSHTSLVQKHVDRLLFLIGWDLLVEEFECSRLDVP